MPFDETFINPRLSENKDSLIIDYKTKDGKTTQASFSLKDHLGNDNGKFKWGSGAFKETTKKDSLTLNGSILSGKLELNNRKGSYVDDRIDLSLYIKNNNGQLEDATLVKLPTPAPMTRSKSGSPTPSLMDPPPAYLKETQSQVLEAQGKISAHTESKVSESQSKVLTYTESKSLETQSNISAYRAYRSSKVSHGSHSTSYFTYSVASDKLRLEKSILYAQCLKLDGSYVSQQLDLDQYIGVVNGHLVWGRKGFYSACHNIRLEKYVLHAECHDEAKVVIKTSLDLSRYLQSYDGVLGIKVTVDSPELSKLFGEARWMKFRVITEPDSSVDLGSSVFKSALSSLAEATSPYVVSEMNQYLAETIGQNIKSTLIQRVKAEMTRNVTSSVTTQLRKQLSEKVEVTFNMAKKSVMETCNETIDTAVKQVTTQCTDSVMVSVGEQVATQCNLAILSAVQEVTSTAIAHFQERVEILMEREMMMASIRRARTQAALLSVYEELSSGASHTPVPHTPIPHIPVPPQIPHTPTPPQIPHTPIPPQIPQPVATSVISYLNAPIPSPWTFGPGAAPTPPDLAPGYNPASDVEKILKATERVGTDEAALISTLAHLGSLQLASLGAVFKMTTGKELVAVLDSETSWWFKETLHGLTLGPLWYDVELVSRAVKKKINETLLTELLASRSSADLKTLSFAYQRQYKKDLQTDVKGDLSAKTDTMFTRLLSSTRPPDNTPVDHQAVERDVELLYKAGQTKLATDETVFCDIIINSSTPQLTAIVDLYGRKYKSLTKAIKSKFSGHMRTTLLHIVNAVNPKHISEGAGVWRDAKLLEASMEGMGTSDEQLVWRIVRYHWDPQRFAAIKAAYRRKYKKSLESSVASETSGYYKKLLVALCKGS